MEKLLIKGDVYTVATKTECKVTSANGTPLGKATAENPVSFTATTDRVELSDPDAEFSRVNPKYAPVKLRLLGLLGGGSSTGSALPSGYLAAEFVEKSVVDGQSTSFPDYYGENKGLKMTATLYNLASTTEVVGTPYSSDGYFSHPTNAYYFLSYFGKNYYTSIDLGEKYVVEVNWKNDGMVRKRANTFYEAALAPSKEVWGGRITSGKNAQVKIYDLQLSEGSNVVRNYIPALTPQGGIVLYDTVKKQEVAYKCDVIGFTLAQALKLAELPAGVGELTVSLPWEAQLVASGVPDALRIAAGKGWTIKVQYREAEADSALYNRYAECVTVDDVKAVNADYANDLTPAGEWIYPLPNLENANNSFSHDKGGKLITFRAALPKVTSISYMFGHKGTLEVFESCDMPSLINGYQAFIGNAKLTRFVYSMPALFNGGGMFSGCKLDKESVLVILNSIPAYTSGTHNITLGIHVDHETDEEVIAAIAEAEAKGWAVTVQWNGTSTAQAASTFGLRRPAIYAKVVEFAGEKPLDWGHYVTNWDENGYQEFASVEEANEYFNIGD